MLAVSKPRTLDGQTRIGLRQGLRIFPMKSTQTKTYRPASDQSARVASYRSYWIVGKLILLILFTFSLLMAGGIVADSGISNAWLFIFQVGFLVAVLWKGFPAFCRCPGCGKKMTHQSSHSRNPGLVDSFLVCDSCMIFVRLSSTSDLD